MHDTDQLSSELSKLELEVELQGKITAAAHRLASDKTVTKYVRKQRRQSYSKSLGKLKDMEKKLDDMRKKMGKPSSGEHHTSRSLDDRSSNKNSSQTTSPAQTDSEDHSHRTALSPSHSSPQLSAGYAPNGGVAVRGHHAAAAYPSTFGAHNSGELDSGEKSSTAQFSANLRLDGSHDSGFSSANNMYNVNSQRTSHYESTDRLRSPATSEPGVITPLLSQVTYETGPYFGPFKRGPGDEPFQRKTAGPSSSNLHYGSLDRKRRDYRQEIYRDVSPVRYKLRQGQDGDSKVGRSESVNEGRYRDVVNPTGVLVEVPVLHERGQSVPPSSSIRQAWGDHTGGGSLLHQSSDPERLKQGAVGQSTSFSSERCYSPRMYEGSSYRPYQDIDVSHVHLKGHQDHNLHHTTSQPMFHRTERSISPLRSQHGFPSHYSQQHQRPLPPSGFDRQQGVPQSQQSYHYQQPVTSPSHSQQSPAGYYPSPARTIPIQRIETQPASSSLPQYHHQASYHGGSPASSGPSSPRGPASHATSTLVTVTRLQPHTEISKPYEMSDFYRYSEKLRRQRIIDHYQRQLIGADWMSRSSSPMSVESEGLSSHSGSASSSHTIQSPTHQPFSFANTSSSLKHSSRGPPLPYNRSVSAPVTTMQPSFYSHQMSSSSSSHHNQPLSASSHYSPTSPFPEGQVSSSSSTFTVKTHGPNMQYAMQSSTYKIQQVHSSTKHSMYQPPQPMTCKPVITSPSNQPDSQRR